MQIVIEDDSRRICGEPQSVYRVAGASAKHSPAARGQSAAAFTERAVMAVGRNAHEGPPSTRRWSSSAAGASCPARPAATTGVPDSNAERYAALSSGRPVRSRDTTRHRTSPTTNSPIHIGVMDPGSGTSTGNVCARNKPDSKVKLYPVGSVRERAAVWEKST